MRAFRDLKRGPAAAITVVLGLLLVLVAPAVAAAAAPAPGWTISSLAQPTNFASLDTVQSVAVDATGGTFTLTLHTGEGEGTLTSGSSTVSDVKTATGAFRVGDTITTRTGTKIPAGTTILAVGAGTLTLSQDATERGESEGLIATETTVAIDYDASAAELQTAVEKLGAVGAGNVSVSGGPGDSGATSPYVVAFLGSLAGTSVPEMTADSESLTGGIAHTATVSVLTEGGQGASSSGRNYYVLVIRNAGSVASKGQVTITDTLPPGLEATSITPNNVEEWATLKPPKGFSCVLATPLRCTDSEPVPALGMLTVTITVSVKTGAPEDLTNSATISGGGAPTVSTDAAPNEVNALTAPPFGSPGFEFGFFGPDGTPDTQAGDHPYQLTVSGYLNTVNPPPSSKSPSEPPENAGGNLRPVQNIKDVVTELPLGFVGNPQAAPTCNQNVISSNEFRLPGSHGVIPACPPGSEIGYVAIESATAFTQEYPQAFEGNSQDSHETDISMLYNVTPEHGYAAEFGFSYFKQVSYVYPSLNHTHAGYVLRVSVPGVPRALTLLGFSLTFFGNPLLQDGVVGPGSAEPDNPGKAFFTDPTDCSDGPPRAVFHLDSWQNPAPVALNPDGSTDLNEADYEDPQWATATSTEPQPTGCDLLSFEPLIEFAPSPPASVEGGSTRADTPSGYTFGLTVPQKEKTPTELATPELKNATVTLPAGVSLSPPTASGLVACSDEEIDLESEQSGTCPEASEIGTVKIVSPLLAGPLEGRVYVGEPECGNATYPAVCDDELAEAGRVYRLVIQAEIPHAGSGSGLNVKLLGTVKANPVTGQLTAEFKENPQLPFSHLELKLKDGPRAPLANPQECGTFTTTSDLSPWSAPETPDATPESSFAINESAGGGSCPGSLPFGPSFSAGTVSPQAGSYTPFTLTFGREDGEQDLGGLTLHMPDGLLGKLAGLTECPEPQAAEGSCPESSQIGHVSATAGSGGEPLVVPQPGQPQAPVYFTGPYEGAPFGLSIVVPAVAGPFNLGTVVVRAKINVDPKTAALTVTTGPIPSILDGAPLRLRTISTLIDRPEFILNPTNCAPQAIGASIQSTEKATAAVQAHFQAANCADLSFKPRFTVSTSGHTSKADGASLTATVSYPSAPQGSEANVAAVKVDLPKQLPSRLTTLQKACTSAQFEANPAGCPAASKIGYAVVHTPVLPVALEGPAIFVSHGGEAFPSLTLVLQGDGVTIDLVGSTFISKAGITSTTFKSAPDAPFSTFLLRLPQGPYSALAANGNLCASKLAMPNAFRGQNGAEIHKSTPIEVTGCSHALSVSSHRVKKRTLTLSVYVPASGRVKVSGNGLSSQTKTAQGREILTFKLHQKHAGRLKTKVELLFSPKTGKRQHKALGLRFRR